MIDRQHPLSGVAQCKLLGLSRARVYRLPTPPSAEKLDLMKRLDRLHLDHPHMGSRSLRDQLNRQGIAISRGRVKSLMRKMGIAAVYQKPRTTIPNLKHKVYPYLLRHRAITRPNDVWCADITYIPMAKGFAYLVAVMDWASRKVLSWRLSNTITHVYLHSYDSIADPKAGLKTYFGFFNQERTHQSLARQTPDEVYFADRLREAA
jgi:putative transposase